MKRIERDGRERVISMEEWRRGTMREEYEAPYQQRGRQLTPSNDLRDGEFYEFHDGQIDWKWIGVAVLAGFGMAWAVVLAIRLALRLMR